MQESINSPHPPPQSYRILVVDDEEIVLVALQETLRRERYEVVAFSDPAKALAELKKGDFAVIISDQRMPGMTGLELLAHARQIQPYATRILVTAVLSLDTVIDAINKGEIYRFIVKPWLREELLVTLKNSTQRYDLVRQNSRLNTASHAMNDQLQDLNRSLEEQVKVVAQQNQQLTEVNQTLEQSLRHSLELSLHTIQTFLPALGSQSRRVAELCRSLGDAAELSPEDKRILEHAALLHDIGLVSVPRSLIRKWQSEPGSLDQVERTRLQQHPVVGQQLAAFGSGSQKVGEVVRSHHERFDGKGYPDQMAGDKIPWLGRLLAVAVAYASSRLDPGTAMEEIKLTSGTAFDPEAVRALLKALPRTSLPRKEREIMLSDLKPGMVLARGIYTANGMLLVPEGQQLNPAYIERLLNHNRVQPITQSLVVYC